MGGSKCVAPNCTVGYDSNIKERNLHKFSVPKYKERLNKWQIAIKRKDFILKPGQVICSKHFLPEDIIWGTESKDASGNVIRFEYKIPLPKKDAIPTHFTDCPKYLSNGKERRKSPTKRNSSPLRKVHKIELKNKFVEETEPVRDCSKSNSSNLPKENIIPNDEPESETNGKMDKDTINLFTTIFVNDKSISYPFPWIRQNLFFDDGKKIKFVKCTTKLINSSHQPVCLKQLVINENLSIHVYINGHHVNLSTIGFQENSFSVAEVETLLEKLETAKTCQELPW